MGNVVLVCKTPLVEITNCFRFLSTLMVHGCYTHWKDQAQYALCDLCVFKRHNLYYFCNFTLECESSECLLLVIWFIWICVDSSWYKHDKDKVVSMISDLDTICFELLWQCMHSVYLFCFTTVLSYWDFLWEIQFAFPRESQLQHIHMTQTTVHARCFSVSLVT